MRQVSEDEVQKQGLCLFYNRDAHPSRGPTAVSSVRARGGLAPLLDACMHTMRVLVPREVSKR